MMSELDVDEIMAEACRLSHAGVRGQHSNSMVVRLCAEIRVARTARDAAITERDAAVAERDRLKAAMQSASKNAEAQREEHASRWKKQGDMYSQGYSDAADVLFQPIDDALTPWAERRAALDGKAVAP